MTPPAEVREALRELEKADDAHDYFARNSDLRMTTGDHAREAKRIRAAINDLTAQLTEANALRDREGEDAAIGRVVWRYIDRMNDVAPESGDPAERILGEFVAAVMPHIDAALQARKQEDTNADG